MGSPLICDPHDNQHVINVLHAVLNIQKKEEPFIPSDYLNEMKMSPEDRLENLYKSRKNRIVPGSRSFLATPDMIIFQNSQLGKSYNATLTLQNKEKSSRCIKVVFETSVHFRLLYPSKVVWTKLAPGMTYQVIVAFTADEIKDFQHKVTFVTEDEEFFIPIYAFKPRPLIDFPDSIKLPDVPIRMTSEKNIIVKNSGIALGSFSMITTDPCTACPAKVVLNPNEKMFIKITLKTKTQGKTHSEIIIRFDDDIRLKINIECNAVSSTILFQNNSLSFQDTFMGLERQVPLTIEYHGIGIGYYKWKLYKDSQTEKMRKMRLSQIFEHVRDAETVRCLPLTQSNIVDKKAHSVVYQRIFDDEVEEVQENEEFLFHNATFTIMPLTGDIGMNGLLEFIIIFTPKTCDTFETFAYLEIAGKEERIPLKLQGTGLGPEFKLNVSHLEANNIFLRSIHDYEIIVANTGHIPGSITYLEKHLDFGGKIKCLPDTLHVSSDHYAAFVVSFTPGEEGRFIEKIEFVVNESKEKIHFIMSGNVIAPLLTLDINEINFGVVALGFKQSKEVVFYNNSPVPIKYNIEISNDGYQTPIACEEFLQDVQFPQHPREFSFYPQEGVVLEESLVVGMLTILPNVIRERKTKFVVHMWGSKNYCISIPLTYECRVAEIVCIPPKIDIKFCFINYVYERTLVLKNITELPCQFRFRPLEMDNVKLLYSKRTQTICIQKDYGVIVEVTIPRHYIPPLGNVKIFLKIQTPNLGRQNLPLYFSIFGIDPEVLCEVICNGQGPSICFIPPNLNFGKVTLLDTATKVLEILNDTPIPATINFTFKKPGAFCLTHLEKRVIPPNSKQDIEISVYLTDPGRHTQMLMANVEDGQEMAVVLTAYGEGASIKCIPKVGSKLDLGILLTHKKYLFPLLLVNEGSRWHKMWFSRSDNLKIVKNSPNSSGGVTSVFKIAPNYFHLLTKESVEVKISGSNREQGYVSEHFYCHAVIEKSHAKHIIFSFDVVAKFVDPYLVLSKSEINFSINVSSDGITAILRDKIKIRNESGISLEIDLTLHSPFYMVVDDKLVSDLYLKLNNLSNRTITVEFQPPPHLKRSTTYHQAFYINYRDHPKVESVPVKGIFNYPTLSINPQKVDFGCVPLGSSSQQTIALTNISPLPVIYKWVWVDDIVETKFQDSVLPASPKPSKANEIIEESQETTEEPQINHQELVEVESTDSCMIESEIHNMLSSLLSDQSKDEEDKGEIMFLRTLPTSTSKSKFSQYFRIIPHEGCLEPEESTVTHFRFTPPPNTEVSGTVYCRIVGGANEPVTLTGKCRQISYCLKDSHISFGKIYYYEETENEASITNDGEGKFSFVVSKVTLPSGRLTIEPTSEQVRPGETQPLTLTCFPGSVGRFETSFRIEVNHLDPSTITVSGFGVYPQIYLPLPRPDLAKVDPVITYSAIAELGNEVHECVCADYYFSEIDKKILEDDGWVVISVNQHKYPCTMEIDLSIERIWAKYQLEKIPHLTKRLAGGEKFWPLPDLTVAPYVFDLGCRQINTKSNFTLTYVNYGPARTVVKTHVSQTFSTHEFDSYGSRHLMDLNQVSELPIHFHPTTDRYKELNTKVTEFIYMDVRNGPRIPIQIEVLVATPTVKVSNEEIDFGSIRCGDCLRKSISLINNGHLTSHWRVNIEESSKVRNKIKSFFTLTHHGLLKPSEKIYLRVYFEPHYDDFLSAKLVITVDGNFRQTVVQLKGIGMEPFLEIKEEKIFFDPCIPYSRDNDRYVTIRNASKFPVEFFFADFDEKILQEEALVRYFLIDHVVNKLYVPYRAPGDELPDKLKIYYVKLVQEIETKIAKQKTINEKDGCSIVPSKTIRNKRPSPLPCDPPLSGKVDIAASWNNEMDDFITNYLTKKIKRLSKTKFSNDPSLTRMSPDSEAYFRDAPMQGDLLVFHGGPLSDYTKTAHETGKSLNIPVCSIDRLIIESLVQSTSATAREINDMINTAFEEVAEEYEMESNLLEDSYDFIKRKVLILSEERKPNKKPKEKITKPKTDKQDEPNKSPKSSKDSKKSSKDSKKSTTNTAKESSGRKTDKKSKSSDSKTEETVSTSKKSKKKNKQTITDTLIDLPQQMLCSLLEESMEKFPQGLIIESLESNFLKKTMVALNCMLQLSKNTDAVYFVILSSTFDNYVQTEEEQEEKRCKEMNENLDGILALVEDMDAEEFMKVKNELPQVYENYIKNRKEDVIARRELLKQRKKSKNKQTQKELKTDHNQIKSKAGATRSSENLDKKFDKEKPKKLESSKGSQKSKKSKDSGASKQTETSKKSVVSKISQQSGKKKKEQLTPEQAKMKESFKEFEETLPEILYTLDNWDRINGTLRTPVSSDTTKPKNKKSARSPTESDRSGISSAETSLTEISHPDIGINCWLINRAPFNKINNFIPTLLKTSVEVGRSHKMQIAYDSEEPDLLQTVIPKPKKRTLKKTDVFSIVDYIRETIEDEAKDVDSGSNVHGKRRRPSKAKSPPNSPIMIPLLRTDFFTHRGLLEPGATVKYKINFLPKTVGNYKHQFDIGVVGWPAKFTITCIACCDTPRIEMDPYFLFDRVIGSRSEKRKYAHCLFVQETNQYEFGGILVPNANTNSTFEVQGYFHLNNISRITCEVYFSIKNNCPVFKYRPDSHVIEPKCRKDVTVVAAPLEEKIYQDSLIFSLKNNPKIERIKLNCYGCEIGVDVFPKHVLFERVSLEISLKKDIVITNNTPVEVSWRFVNCQAVLENFKISKFSGKISTFSVGKSCVEFTAKEIEVPSSSFLVNVYDPQNRLVYSTDIIVSAEITTLELNYENILDFGDVKGWNSHSIPFKITSKGRFEIQVQFSNISDENKEAELYRKYFTIEPLEGKLLADSTFQANVTFLPDKNMTLDKLPVFTCSLIDPFHQVLIKSFDICNSAKVFLSKFEMCPFPEIYYGYQTVGSEKVHIFQILNKGRFDFTYSIEDAGASEKQKKKKQKDKKTGSKSQSKSSKSKSSKDSKKSKSSKTGRNSKVSTESKKSQSRKSSKSSKTSKTTDGRSKSSISIDKKTSRKKLKATTLNFGVFSLTSSTGIVYPSEEAFIEVRSKPTEAGQFQETVLVKVSEPSYSERDGKKVNVHVIACEPKVNFDDISNIFKEQYIVKKIDDFISSNIEANTVFSKSEMKLRFNKVCVNTTEITRLRIQNVGHVTAHVTAKFTNSTYCLKVSPDAFSIDPYQTESVMIIFSPISLDEQRSVLTLECRGFHTVDTLSVEVIGESCAPEILVVEPQGDEQFFMSIDFPATLLGYSYNHEIVFKNIGRIPCKVIIEVCYDDYDQLVLTPDEKTIPLLNIWDPLVPMRHTNLVNLERGAQARFYLQLTPTKIGAWKAEVKIYTVNNPFETKTIYVFCEGYYMDVVLEGLYPYTRSFSSISIETVPVLGYALDFKQVSLNSLEKKCFIIRNDSRIHTYKFEFPSYNEVLFTPAVGHLRPQTNKQIIAVFLSKYPMSLDQKELDCSIYQIEYVDHQPDLLAWDDRQNLVVWCSDKTVTEKSYDCVSDTSSKASSNITSDIVSVTSEKNPITMKKIEQNPEPQINIVPNTYQNLALFVSVTAGYATFTCDVCELIIPDTFVLHKKSVAFNVQNTGCVDLKISWSLTMQDLPRRINSCTCFSERTEENSLCSSSKYGPAPLNGNENFLYGEQPKRSASASTLFSCITLDTNRSGDSWNEDGSLPFSVTPNKVTIPPKSKQTFTVTFTPIDVFDYTLRLKSDIENLSFELNNVEIEIKARSVLPLYCFDLEQSDYAETRRKGKKICDDIFDEETKVVEFESVGLGVICTRNFLLKNPTKDDFVYNWKAAHAINPHLSCFHCHTSQGTLSKGKSANMVFSFIPKECGIFEEFYYFSIPTFSIQVTFLLVGSAREPRIYFDKNHVSLPTTVIGVDVVDRLLLKNDEEEKYRFKFRKLSMLAESITIHPMSGFIFPQETIPIKILYSPKRKASVHFDIHCVVDRIRDPLEVSISYNCFEIEASITYTDQTGKEIQLHPKHLNVLNLGMMVPHQKYKVPFTLTNIGKTGFHWHWKMHIDKISGLFDIFANSSEEVVHPNETTSMDLTVVPLIKCHIQPHKIYIKIPYGPSFAMQISGSSAKSPSKLSFTEYDFGACLVQTGPTKYYKTVLKFFNYNIWPMTIEQGKHENHISTDLTSAEVLPQQEKNINVYFHPLTSGKHQVQLPLYVDGKRTHVTIYGKGVLLKITILNQNDKFIDLGSVLVGKTVNKTVRLLNDSECTVNVFFNFWNRLPKKPTKETPDEQIEVPKEEATKPQGKKGTKDSKGSKNKKKDKESKRSKDSKTKKTGRKSGKKGTKKSDTSKKSKEGKVNAKSSKTVQKSEKSKQSKVSKILKKAEGAAALQEAEPEEPQQKQGIDYLTITPEKCIKVGPHKISEFTITFRPQEKVEPFLEKIFFRSQNYIDAFCVVKGRSIAADISLDRYHLTFGNVVVNFERIMNVVLRNTGDIPLNFTWLYDKKEENFSITPTKGYILPNTDLIFDVFFRPKTVKCWIKSKLICNIAKINKELQLSVSGSCIHVPPPKGTIVFSCPVRESYIKSITIPNPTNQVWEITPRISGDTNFKTLEILRIPPKQEDKVEILFSPMTLQDHSATLCVPTPDGLIMSYNLKGIGTAPLPAKKIVKEVICKVQHLEHLPVKNWLLVKQQFLVSTVVSGRVTAKNLYTVSGNSLIEVPPNSTRMYEWGITPINEGPLDLKVIFTNKTTKEYLFHEISLKVLPNKLLASIEFNTCARNPITKIIKLENPLNVPVEYGMTCSKDNLQFEKSVKLEPHTVHNLEIIYTPPHEEKETILFEASCPEMGRFCYNLELTSHAPVPEPPTMFKTHLGHLVTQKIDVVTTRNCQFIFDHPIFFLDSVVGDHNLMITFEPEQIGKFHSRLHLKSPQLGDYIYPLMGESCLPKPQGPYLLTFHQPVTINFKNPFSEEKQFLFHTEPSDFRVKQITENIGSKKVFKAVVNLITRRTGEEAMYPITGRLTISCKNPAIYWVYYLQEHCE